MDQINMENVSLEDIFFESTTNSIVFKLYDTAKYSNTILKCYNVMCMNYSCLPPNFEELLPCLVVDIHYKRLNNDMISKSLFDLNFAFKWNETLFVPKNEEYWRIKFEGGPIFFDIICAKILKSIA